MNDSMAIRRSCESGKYLLREGNYVWRMDENGKVDCTANVPTTMFKLLNFLQTCKSPYPRLLQYDPHQDTSHL